MPEKLTLEEALGESGAVHGHEGLIAARAPGMDDSREHLLAGTARTGQKNTGGRGRNLPHHTAQLLHRGAEKYQLRRGEVPAEFFGQQGDPRFALHLPQRPPHDQPQFIGALEGFEQIVDRPGLHGLDGALDAAVRGDDDPSSVGTDLSSLPE